MLFLIVPLVLVRNLVCTFSPEIETQQLLDISGPSGTIHLNDFVQPYVCSPYDFGPTPNYSTDLEFQHIVFPGKTETIVAPCDIPQEQQMVERMARIILSKQLEDFWPDIAYKTQRVLDLLVESADKDSQVMHF